MTNEYEIWHDGEWLFDVFAANETQALRLAYQRINLDGLEVYPG